MRKQIFVATVATVTAATVLFSGCGSKSKKTANATVIDLADTEGKTILTPGGSNTDEESESSLEESGTIITEAESNTGSIKDSENSADTAKESVNTTDTIKETVKILETIKESVKTPETIKESAKTTETPAGGAGAAAKQPEATTDNSKNAPENNGNTESTGGQAKQNTDTGFPEGSEPYQQYLSRTNDPDPTNIQYNMDFERFLRDHGATEIVYGGDFDGGVNAYVSYKNNIIVKLEFHERIPYTMHYAWSGGVIFANSRGPFTTMGDGYGESDWGKTYSMDRRPYDEMDYNDYFQISPDDAFYTTWEEGSSTPTGIHRPPLSLERRFYENYMKYIDPYATLSSYSMQTDPLN
jgi:lipoprotein